MISWPAICPFRYLSDTVYSSWEYGRPTPHWLHLYWRPVERARSEKKTQSSRPSAPRRGASGAPWAQRSTALLWTLRPRPPLPPPSPLGKGSNDHLFVLRELSRLACAAPLRCKDVPGEARSLDGRSSFPKGKYSPSESESANNICNTSSRYKFLLAIGDFLSQMSQFTRDAVNWTASASMTRSLTFSAISSNTLNRNRT